MFKDRQAIHDAYVQYGHDAAIAQQQRMYKEVIAWESFAVIQKQHPVIKKERVHAKACFEKGWRMGCSEYDTECVAKIDLEPFKLTTAQKMLIRTAYGRKMQDLFKGDVRPNVAEKLVDIGFLRPFVYHTFNFENISLSYDHTGYHLTKLGRRYAEEKMHLSKGSKDV